MRRMTLAILGLLVLFALAVAVLRREAGQPAHAQPPAGTAPLEVTEATIEPLATPAAGGNVVLRVRYAPGRPPPPARVPYDTEGGRVMLADDGKAPDANAGDGVYTALGHVDLAAFQGGLERSSRSKTAVPSRTWRKRWKELRDTRLDPRQLRPGREFRYELWGDYVAVDAARSLMIRDLAVVEDPTRTRASCGQASMGVWSFGYLMEQMANTPVTGVTGSELARAWLDTWASPQAVNGWTVGARPIQRVLDDWIAASGGPGQPLDLSRAPFRLLAIVNRLDLRDQAAYGGTSGGELRFVFGFTRTGCTFTRTFQVIFEFGVPARGCLGQKAYARQWQHLATLPLGSPAYNAALEAITQPVVTAGAGKGRPNLSLLNQLRVNENLLDPSSVGTTWEVREFTIDRATHHLTPHTIAQTPDFSLHDSDRLGDYANPASADILANDYVLPLQFPAGSPFRGGAIEYAIGSFLDASGANPIIDREARHLLSLNACHGCHASETETEFRHVGNEPFGTPAHLSGFLTGQSVPDRVDHTPIRFFNDLERRAVDLDALLGMSCFVSPLDFPLRASH